MELLERHCWAEIDVDALKHNYNLIKNTFGRPFYAVVKADAYGHGARYLAKLYSEMDCFGFCVASFGEAMELRKAGITKPVLILGYTEPAKAYDLFKNNLTQNVFSLEYATALNANALYPVDCHVKLDTGMGRLGFDLVGNKEQAWKDIKKLPELTNLKFSGVFSHFAVADGVSERDLMYTQKQMDLFTETVKLMPGWGFRLKTIHGQNSAAISRKLNGVYNTMRAGIILYGHQPSDEVILPEIRPAIKLKTIVTHIKTIKEGQSLGYGLNFTAQKETKVATIAAGYADGVDRLLSYLGHSVEINGTIYPVIGNICMDQMMVDVTDSDVKVGDEVMLLGGEGEISFTKTGAKIRSNSYELMCGITKRVPRVYIENGKTVHIEYGI